MIRFRSQPPCPCLCVCVWAIFWVASSCWCARVCVFALQACAGAACTASRDSGSHQRVILVIISIVVVVTVPPGAAAIIGSLTHSQGRTAGAYCLCVSVCLCLCVSVCVCVGYAKTSPDSLSLRSPCSFLALPRSPLPLSLPRMCRVQNTAFHQRLRETRARLNGAAVAFLSQWQQWFVDEHSRRFRLVRRPAVLGRGRKQGLMSAAPGDNEYMHTHTHSLTHSLSHTQLTLTHTHAHHLCVSLPPCAGNGCLLLSGVTLGSRWPHGRHTK